ncbi:hypothetical protein KSV96_05635 [Catenibacterium mitsuokai]|uniref:hypothetical protein n=1 Tax=Catenibacterium mitsuokai TaxID=100886 RepID=UPI001C387DD7|nr:hypothetical protein [Catenibacterium mitsuokai]MBV3378194.1 hypothetical protein [Catenibacterium mitsuokai]
MKTIKNYVSLFILFLICKEVFYITFIDFADIKYFFPQRLIYIVFSLLVNYFYLKIVFDCIFQYIEIDTFTIIRMGRKKYHTTIFKIIVDTLVVFVLFSILTDFFFCDICILGLIGTVCIEIVVGLCMSLLYKRLGTHTFMITFILIVFTKYLITLASGIMS